MTFNPGTVKKKKDGRETDTDKEKEKKKKSECCLTKKDKGRADRYRISTTTTQYRFVIASHATELT
jgi:hypothetical protein